MRKSDVEGVASRDGPEPCVGAREGVREASVGVRAGLVLSREINEFGVPTPLYEVEGNIVGRVIASGRWTPRGRRPSACMESPGTRTGRSRDRPS
jgi:hypothetical protein